LFISKISIFLVPYLINLKEELAAAFSYRLMLAGKHRFDVKEKFAACLTPQTAYRSIHADLAGDFREIQIISQVGHM
jgi:hypothetical protein